MQTSDVTAVIAAFDQLNSPFARGLDELSIGDSHYLEAAGSQSSLPRG